MRESVAQTVEAVETALAHLAGALERGGFAAGEMAYRQMAGIVVGQRLWTQNQGIEEFDKRFDQIAALAGQIHAQLTPYVEVMEQLGTLEAIGRERPVDPESLGGRILQALREADRPLSVTAIRQVVARSTVAVKRELEELVEHNLVARTTAGARVRYTLVPR